MVQQSQLIPFYKEMLFYRRFEERVNSAYTRQKFAGFCHLHIGQEAVCVGVQACLHERDYVLSSYRSHTQAIAKGIPAQQVMAELFGKVTGCSRGKGGSMHMFSREHRFLGGQGIVGAQVPVAVGVGFAIKYRQEDDIAVCYIGDAAMNQGQTSEAMNMAGVWPLPVLFILENNGYGMGTAIQRTTLADRFLPRAESFGLIASAMDGMDVVAVHDAIQPIVQAMRQDGKPRFVEAHTYRYKGHSVSDPGTYRTKEEVQEYQERDPLRTLAQTLRSKNLATAEELDAWDQDIKQQMKAVEDFADQSAEPELDELWQHVYAD